MLSLEEARNELSLVMAALNRRHPGFNATMESHQLADVWEALDEAVEQSDG
jgi:hypothetical protein